MHSDRSACASTVDGVAAITAWLDGGWGVDVLDRADEGSLRSRPRHRYPLSSRGSEASLWPTGSRLSGISSPPQSPSITPTGGRSTCTPAELTDDGGGDQIQLDGVKRWHYDAPTTGRIAGRPVACCTVGTQIKGAPRLRPGRRRPCGRCRRSRQQVRAARCRRRTAARSSRTRADPVRRHLRRYRLSITHAACPRTRHRSAAPVSTHTEERTSVTREWHGGLGADATLRRRNGRNDADLRLCEWR